MKAFVKKAAAAVILVLLTLSFATCEDVIAGIVPSKSEPEYVDWEYVELPDGRAELTMYLDGTLVPVTETTASQKQARALGLRLAQMSHDYFEAVFVQGSGPTAVVARATWELGQAAGISGVQRSSPGYDYRGITPPAAATDSASIVFVGRKQTMTLLGVGYLTHINKQTISGSPPQRPSALLTTADRSVTFTVSPLTAKIGLKPDGTGAVAGTPADFTADSSFVTNVVAPFTGTPDPSTTRGRNTPLGGTEYPLFTLPDWAAHTGSANAAAINLSDGTTVLASGSVKTIDAQYIVGGLTTAAGTFFKDSNNLASLLPAVRLIAPPEVIKREPRYIAGGQTWYAVSQIDFAATLVDIPLGTGGYTAAANDALIATLPIKFYISTASNGIFSIVFQIPVYAITTDASTNTIGGTYERWNITPGYGQNLYNLDNGNDAGGCVLLGINVSSLDWLDIFTTGIGFRN